MKNLNKFKINLIKKVNGAILIGLKSPVVKAMAQQTL